MTHRCHTHTYADRSYPSYGKQAVLAPPLEKGPVHTGFLPTTSIATPHGWRSAASLLGGDEVVCPTGHIRRILSVEHITFDLETADENEANAPIHIPGYALGNLSSFAVLPDQTFALPRSVMGLQGLARQGKVKARDLIGRNGIRQMDIDENPVAVTLLFDDETVVSCAHGSFAICAGRLLGQSPNWGSSLAA